MYGILIENNGKLAVHNKIFETLLYDYLLAKQKIRKITSRFMNVDKNEVIDNSQLNMEKLLIKFKEFMYEEYREEDEHFYETNGRLIFLAYLKPILNGKGFSFVEPQTRENKRMDVVITYGNEKHIAELKIWNGEKYEAKGLNQLAEYLEIQGLSTGYLITFNFNKNKKYKADWLEVVNKRIFEVVL
jgi:hypothetical protein